MSTSPTSVWRGSAQRTDIVGSTEKAVALGDNRWRDLLDSHHAVIRRNLTRFRGNEVKSTGDGILATFDGPARGVRCACAIAEEIKPLGIEVRAGLHSVPDSILVNAKRSATMWAGSQFTLARVSQLLPVRGEVRALTAEQLRPPDCSGGRMLACRKWGSESADEATSEQQGGPPRLVSVSTTPAERSTIALAASAFPWPGNQNPQQGYYYPSVPSRSCVTVSQ